MRYCENGNHESKKYEEPFLIQVTGTTIANEGYEIQNTEFWCLKCIKREMQS